MKHIILPSVVVMGLLAFGCNKNKSEEPTVESASAAPSAPAAPSVTEVSAEVPSASAEAPVASEEPLPSAAVSSIPTPEQYEKKATAAVTKTNAAQELTKLEKEIGQ
jgi:hypothetical protein